MAEEPKSQSWWQTVPGVLTATAGIITAVAGLVVALHQAGILKVGDKWTPPAYNDTAKSAEHIESTLTSPKHSPDAQTPKVSGKPSGSSETKPVGTRQGELSDEFSTVQWGFQILNMAEADVYVERYYQEGRIIRPQGRDDILIVIDARLKNHLPKTQKPILTERFPGNTGLIDHQGHSYQPLDYDARQEMNKIQSAAGAPLLPGAVADFALVFSVLKGTKPKTLVFTLNDYDNIFREGTVIHISLER